MIIFHSEYVYAKAENTEKTDEDQQITNDPVVTSYKLSFLVQSLGDLTDMIGLEIPPSGPVSISGDLAFTQDGFTLNNIELQMGRSDIKGHLDAILTGQRPAVTAVLKSETIDLTEYYAEADKTEQTEKKEKLFSRDNLPFEVIKNTNIDLVYSADSVITHDYIINDLQLAMKIQDGYLHLDPVSAMIANGRLDALVSVNTNLPDTEINVSVLVNGFEPGHLPNLQEANAVTGVQTDFELQVSGKGNNIADIMGSLNGHFLAQAGEGKSFNRKIDTIADDIFIDAANMLNPFRKQTTDTDIICSVIKFDIKDGLAQSDKGIALQTRKMNILGSGIIDFKSENLDFAIHPAPRKGINLKIGNLVEVLQLTGTLSEPKVRPSNATALKIATRATAAIFSFGLSILAEGLLNKAMTTDDPCGLALDKSEATGPGGDLIP